MLLSCGGDAPPALTAAGVEYAEDELLGLSDDRRMLLGELTAFGVAVATGELPALGEPRLQVLRRDRLWRLLQARHALDSAGVGDDVLRARYGTEPELELTVRHLLVMAPRYQTDETRAEARAKAERALERIRAGEPFPRVAAEVSEEPGAEGREGLLSPGREGSWVDEFWAAARALEPGQVSRVVETQYGFHVLRLEDRRTVPFEEVRASVALEVAGMIADLEPAASSAPLPVDIELTDGAVAALEDPAADGSTTVARWQGGELTLDTLRAALAGTPPERASPGADAAERVERVARAVAAARAASEAGLGPEPAWEEETRRAWLETAEGWAVLLGFTPGMSAEQAREAAVAALGARRQNASLARDELRRQAAGLLHHAYAIETAPAGGA